MKRTIQFVLAACAVAFFVGCSCTTETHNVRIKETTYRTVTPKAPSGPESFNPVERY